MRAHAEAALKAMLSKAHEQQGQLEDVENEHKAAADATFDELRDALKATEGRLADEVKACM